MPYWVYGTDVETNEPAEMLSDAATVGAAVDQALDQGIRAERVVKAADPKRPKRNRPLPRPRFTAGLAIGTACGLLVAVLWSYVAVWIDKEFNGVAAVLTYLTLPTLFFALGWQMLGQQPNDPDDPQIDSADSR